MTYKTIQQLKWLFDSEREGTASSEQQASRPAQGVARRVRGKPPQLTLLLFVSNYRTAASLVYAGGSLTPMILTPTDRYVSLSIQARWLERWEIAIRLCMLATRMDQVTTGLDSSPLSDPPNRLCLLLFFRSGASGLLTTASN